MAPDGLHNVEAPGRRKMSNSSSSNSTSVSSSVSMNAEEQAFLEQLTAPNLPPPLPAEACPLLCCFYAEFDNVVGPQIAHQSPPNFMDQHMDISFDHIHSLLQKTFNDDGEENKTTKQNDNEESIFDSTCDYIITGNELAGKMINLSTHNMHILARPTVISDERFERNTLFFSVGFVLRRTEDPRPFRPVLSKFADILMRLEVEDYFLTRRKPQLQLLLRGLLIRLNAGECNLLLHKYGAIHLKLFKPPKMTAAPVADHDVPVLLRQDWQVQMFDWDLAINWVVNNIDGVLHAKALSVHSEVDPEMVRACLRVLQHHNVVALVDMFFYSNRYEPTGKQLDSKLMQDAMDFVCKQQSQPSLRRHIGGGGGSSSFVMMSSSIDEIDGKPSSFTRNTDKPLLSDDRSYWRKMKLAVAGLYYDFDRSKTIGEVFLDKIKSKQYYDWKSLLSEVDHRRFVTFGIIHGIIRRVHNYPFAVVTQKRPKGSGECLLEYRVADQMNGERCDDALVCQFERPLPELIQMVQEIGSVADIFAT